MIVGDCLIKDITSVTEKTPVKKAAGIMAKHMISGVPVVDSEHKVKGFISEKDIIDSFLPSMSMGEFVVKDFSKTLGKLSDISEAVVEDYMSEGPITTEEDKELFDVMELMIAEGIKILPVVKDGRFIGVINRSSVVKALIEEGENIE